MPTTTDRPSPHRKPRQARTSCKGLLAEPRGVETLPPKRIPGFCIEYCAAQAVRIIQQ
jgi:hypothetical protein